MGKTTKSSQKRAAVVPQRDRKIAAKSSSKKKYKQRSREQIDQARYVLDSNAQTVYENLSGAAVLTAMSKAIVHPTTSAEHPPDTTDHVKALTETIMRL